ncbi:MAG TPA: PQQ-binding-like beta-propeller repeat protein [Candidatus Acidoferrales bacterium]|nr:PQQ-binding-like beta-propeller repeat protein [Candidatus Acidoferrales bacterium]
MNLCQLLPCAGARRALCFLVMFAAFAPETAILAQKLAQTAWPTYRGDFKRTGRTSHKGPATNQLRWVFSTGRSEKEGGIETDPVIGPDGTVYIGANNGIFYALSPADGSIRWVFPTEFDTFAIYSTPAVDQQGIAYFGAKDGKVYAVRAPQRGIMGELVWSISLGTTIQTSPAFTPDGTLVIGADDWAYYGIAPPRGNSGPRILWRFQTNGTLITSPAVDSDGTVFVASMDGKVYALEPPKETGQPVKVRWSFSSGARDEKGGFENAPALDNEGTLYIGGNNGIFYALDTKTGKVRWTFDDVARSGYRTYAIFSSAAIGPDRTIYFGGKNGDLYAIREQRRFLGSGPQVLWRYKLGAGIQSSPLLAGDGTVYLGDERGTLHAITPPASGKPATALWKFSTKGTLISSPALAADGTLYEGSMDGKLYAFKAGATKPLTELPFSGTWYGTYESPLISAPVRAVVRQEGKEVWAAWFLAGAGRGEGHGVVQENRVVFSLPIKTARCQGTARGEGRREGNQIRGEIQIDQCGGKLVSGRFTLRNG